MTLLTCFEIGLFAILAGWEVVNDYRINHPEKHKRLVTLVPYTVQKGDTLYALASKFNTTVGDLKKWNSDKLNDGRVKMMREKKYSSNFYDRAAYYGSLELELEKNRYSRYEDDYDFWMQLIEGEIIYVPVWEDVS